MMNRDKLRRLIKDIFATRNDEIQCREAEGLIARCADALLSEGKVKRRYPQLWHHLQFCPNCAEEYRAVIALARAEAEGHLPQTESIPPVPGAAELQMREQIASLISVIFPGFSPSLRIAVTRGDESIVEPVVIDFPEEAVKITIDITTSEGDLQRRDLYCTVTTQEDTMRAQLEGASLWLQTSRDRVVREEKTLDEFGDALFEGLKPDIYDLRLYLLGKEYRITHIEVP
jgi:hypothetical protein